MPQGTEVYWRPATTKIPLSRWVFAIGIIGIVIAFMRAEDLPPEPVQPAMQTSSIELPVRKPHDNPALIEPVILNPLPASSANSDQYPYDRSDDRAASYEELRRQLLMGHE
jgi:hypothetical protein